MPKNNTTQAFVYKWIHKPTGKWYIGSRTAKGCHPDDGYICSSKIVKPMIQANPEEWTREILSTGSPPDMRKLESRHLMDMNAKSNPMSFNMNNSDGKPGWRKQTMTKPLVNNQEISNTKKGRGGARPNSGRKLGSTQKLSAQSLLDAIEKQDVPFAEGLAQDYAKARMGDDKHLVQKYQQMFLGKVLAEKVETDITSNGQTMGVQLVFNPVELPEWNKK